MINEFFECEILRASRARLLQLIEKSNYEILFKIPEGFNNNILWQIGHCITSQQSHMYMRSGLTMYMSKEFEESFKNGSSPASWKITPDVNEVKHLLIGFQVKNYVQALQAANYHEADHSGTIFSYLKRLLKE